MGEQVKDKSMLENMANEFNEILWSYNKWLFLNWL